MESVKFIINGLSQRFGVAPADLFTGVFFTFMLLAAVFYFLFYMRPIFYRKNVINRFMTDLRESPDVEKRLNTLKELISAEDMRTQYPVLFQQWRQYRRHTILIERKDFSTASAEEFFNFESLSGGINVSLWHNLGSVFTGLGILGTFVGFSWGLIAIDKIGSAESVNLLLSGVQTAFFTSIAGIFLALAFNFAHGKFTHSFQSAIEEFAALVDELIPLTTQESLLAQILRESGRQTKSLNSLKQGIQDDVREILEEMQDKMNEAITTALSNSVSENFKPVFEELTTSIRNLSETGEKAIVKELKKGAGKALKEFKDDISGMNEQMKETFDGSIAAMNEAKNAMTVFTETAASINKATEKLSETLNTSIDNMNAAVSPLAQTAASLKESSNAAQILVGDIKDTVATMGLTSQDIKDFYGTQKQTFDELSGNISQSANAFGQSLVSYDTSIGNAVRGLANVASVLNSTEKRLTQEVQALHTMTGGVRR